MIHRSLLKICFKFDLAKRVGFSPHSALLVTPLVEDILCSYYFKLLHRLKI